MKTIKAGLTVLFEDPFWVGICERECNGKYEVCKVTFGAEPKSYDVYEFLLKNSYKLEFGPSVDAPISEQRRINPKRMQRMARKEMGKTGVGTKAQQALKLQYEQKKQEHKAISRQERRAEIERQFELKQQKRKKKHKGH